MVIDKVPSSQNSTKRYLMNLQAGLRNGTRRVFSTYKFQLSPLSDLFKPITPIIHHQSIWRKLTTWIQSMLQLELNIFMRKLNITILVFIMRLMGMERLFSTIVSWTGLKPCYRIDHYSKTCKWPKIINNTWISW